MILIVIAVVLISQAIAYRHRLEILKEFRAREIVTDQLIANQEQANKLNFERWNYVADRLQFIDNKLDRHLKNGRK